MQNKEDILKQYEEKKGELSAETNELLGLYRSILEEKIDYKNDNKYSKPIQDQRGKINAILTEISEMEKQIKRSDKKKIEKKIKSEMKKDRKTRNNKLI